MKSNTLAVKVLRKCNSGEIVEDAIGQWWWRGSGDPDFMQYMDEPVLQDFASCKILSDCGQFYSCTDDFVFLAKLRAGKAEQKEIIRWFHANENRQIAHMAQGILASVYGQDPP